MKQGVMTNPLNREQKMVMDGPEMFWVLTFSTGLLAFSAPAGFQPPSFSMAALAAICSASFLLCHTKTHQGKDALHRV